MGLFDTLLGRTKPVRANLDALFSLPSAAITLQVTAGLMPDGTSRRVLQAAGGPALRRDAGRAGAVARHTRRARADPRRLGRAGPGPDRASGHTPGASCRRQVRIPVDHRRGVRRRRPRDARPHGALLAPGRGLEHPASVFGLRLRARAHPDTRGRHRRGRPRGERVERARPSPGRCTSSTSPSRAPSTPSRRRATSNGTTSSSSGSRACSPRTSPSSPTCRGGSRCGTSPSPERA